MLNISQIQQLEKKINAKSTGKQGNTAAKNEKSSV